MFMFGFWSPDNFTRKNGCIDLRIDCLRDGTDEIQVTERIALTCSGLVDETEINDDVRERSPKIVRFPICS